MYDPWRGFKEAKLTPEWTEKLTDMTRRGRGDILKMTTTAGSGHPGGSMSSLETYLMLYHFARVNPKEPYADDRDRIIVSHGHTSPGVYVALGYAGFFDVNDALYGFRVAGSPFEGHVERTVPGVEWDTGNLGQGLAVGVGKAIYARLSGQKFHTYVIMGDGEQQEGAIWEAAMFAGHYRLDNLCGVIDYNHRQIDGHVEDVIDIAPLADKYRAFGWNVLEIDGHNMQEILRAFDDAKSSKGKPSVIIGQTVMGKNVSFMEGLEEWHRDRHRRAPRPQEGHLGVH